MTGHQSPVTRHRPWPVRALRIIGLLAVVTSLGVTSAAGQVTFKRGVLTITQGRARAVLQVEVADTPLARAQGLMDREHLADNAGMLFIFESTARWAFWMKNTLIPLSIAFIDARCSDERCVAERWEIVDIVDMAVEPDPQNPTEFYESAKPFRYALEVNQGFFRRRGITVGAEVVFTPK